MLAAVAMVFISWMVRTLLLVVIDIADAQIAQAPVQAPPVKLSSVPTRRPTPAGQPASAP